MAYEGDSIVDYLKSINKPSDYTSRSVLAGQYGIKGYTGTAEQNTQLLGTLNKQTSPVAPIAPIAPVAPVTQTSQVTPQPQASSQTSSYSGVSVVDYLNSIGQASDYASRAKLAADKGITNYTGTAEQNTQLLSMMKGSTSPIIPPSTSGITTSDQLRQQEEQKKADETKAALELQQKQTTDITSLTNQKTINDLKTSLGLNVAPPAAPSFASDYEALRSSYGISAIESQINSINTQQNDLEASYKAGLNKQEDRLAPMEIIGSKQAKLTKQYQEQAELLNNRKATLVDEYNTKSGIVSNIMQFKQLDYNAAKADYNQNFSNVINLQQLLDGEKSQAVQEQNQQRDDARANLTVLQNLATDSGKSWDQLDSSMQTQMNTLELKAGIPQGTFKSFMMQKGNLKVDYTTTGYDSAGNQITSFFSYNNGNPQLIKSVGTGAVNQSTSGNDAETLKISKSKVATFLQSVVGEDGKVAPNDYKKAKTAWTMDGLDPLDFDKTYASKYVDKTHSVDYGVDVNTLY